MIHPRCPIPQWEDLCVDPGFPPLPRAVWGWTPLSPCIPEQGDPEIQCSLAGSSPSSPSLRRPVFLAPPIGSYIYEAQDL